MGRGGSPCFSAAALVAPTLLLSGRKNSSLRISQGGDIFADSQLSCQGETLVVGVSVEIREESRVTLKARTPVSVRRSMHQFSATEPASVRLKVFDQNNVGLHGA